MYLFFTYGETYDKIYSTKELLEMLPVLEGKTLSFQTSWGILFKKELFEHIYFPAGKINEDIATNYKCYMQAKKIVYAHKNTYCYRLRNTSISHASFTEKMMRDDHDARIERIALLALKGYDISNYLTQHKQYLKTWHAHAIEKGFLHSRETARLEELDFLLSMNGVKCDE
jgi:glycosyl transferase, family 2/glycosyl transferase family 8